MTLDEKQKVLVKSLQILVDNAGNRITTELANGFSNSLGQFLDSLLVAESKPEAQNPPQEPVAEPPKE